MALIITKQPPILIQAYQPVSFEIQSNSTASPLRLAGGVINVGGDSVQPDGNKKAAFEFSDYLQGLVTERHKTAATPVIYTAVPMPVGFGFRELEGEPPVPGNLTETDAFYVLDGAIPSARRKAFYATYASLLAYLQATKNCLSWWPVTESKKVTAGQREFINYLQLNETPQDLELHVYLWFAGDTGQTMGSVYTTLQDVPYMKTVYFPFSYNSLGIADFMRTNYPTETLESFSVVVKANNSAVSAEYRYTLDTAYYQNRRELYIRNGFGLLEIVNCTGLGEQTNSLKIEIARTDGHILPDKIAWKFDKTDTVKANTGFLTAAQMQWLADMDYSDAYEMIGSTLHPIVFKELSFPVVHDGEYQYSAELEYEYTSQLKTEQA